MKKFLPYILIFIIIANFFAPFSVDVNNKNSPQIVENIAKADDGGIVMTVAPSSSSSEIKVDVNVTWSIDSGTSEGVRVTLKDKDGKLVDQKRVENFTKNGTDSKNQIGSVVFSGLGFNTNYQILTEARQIARLSANISLSKTIVYNFNDLWNDEKAKGGIAEGSLWELKIDSQISTLASGATTFQSGEKKTIANTESVLTPYSCNILDSFTWTGCAGRIIYTLIFQPTSWIFAFAGKFLDWAFFYSVDSLSYRSSFVTEGWAIARDLCNMFFIFILLYIAIGTILKLHSVKTKEMIINVVIIGLFINFSLFATQVIVDASNVLARVFYNTNIINIGDKKGDESTNKIITKLGENGEIRMSEALVNKINPQRLIIESSKVSEDGQVLSAGSFIVVSLLASFVNIVGIIVFLSVGLIFISRVIGLWLAMIFAPIAFFTYAVPPLKGTKMIGWEKWWPDTIKLAFLAPVFMFFMYIILKFLDVGLGIFNADSKTGMGFVIAILVPFIFIMALLLKAKSIASDMSGEMGKTITGAVAAGGGMLLGGAALGAAALGRGTVGAVSKYVQNDGARKKDATTFGDYSKWSTGKKLNPFAYVSQAGKTATAGIATGIHATGLGKKMKEADEGFGHKVHAQHTLDAKMQSEFGHQYGKDAKYKDLTEHEQLIVKAEVDKDELAKFTYGKQFKDLEAPEAKIIKDQYDGVGGGPKLRAVSDEHGKTIRTADVAATLGTGEKIKSDYLVGASKANAAMGEFVQSLRRGGYDVRDISKSKFSSKGIGKTTVGLAAAVATGVRMGLKKGVGIETGTGQKDLFKDIGNTITEALKGIKVNVSTSAGHEDGGHKEVKSVGH